MKRMSFIEFRAMYTIEGAKRTYRINLAFLNSSDSTVNSFLTWKTYIGYSLFVGRANANLCEN